MFSVLLTVETNNIGCFQSYWGRKIKTLAVQHYQEGGENHHRLSNPTERWNLTTTAVQPYREVKVTKPAIFSSAKLTAIVAFSLTEWWIWQHCLVPWSLETNNQQLQSSKQWNDGIPCVQFSKSTVRPTDDSGRQSTDLLVAGWSAVMASYSSKLRRSISCSWSPNPMYSRYFSTDWYLSQRNEI